jgi:hypothetical protein
MPLSSLPGEASQRPHPLKVRRFLYDITWKLIHWYPLQEAEDFVNGLCLHPKMTELENGPDWTGALG